MSACMKTAGLILVLAILTGRGSAQAAASEKPTLAEAEALAGKQKWQEAWKRLRQIRMAAIDADPDPSRSEVFESLWRRVGVEVVGGAASLQGDVEPLPGQVLKLRYGALRDHAARDFETVDLLPDTRPLTLRDGLLSGTGALLHRVPFTGDVTVKVTGAPRSEKDFGLVLADLDEELAFRFLSGNVNNEFFGVKYGRNRRRSEGHVLIFCGRGAESLATENPTQLLARSATPKVQRGQTVDLQLRIKGSTATLDVGGGTITSEMLEAHAMPRIRAGILLWRSAFEPAAVEVVGRPDPAWMAEAERKLREELR